MKFFYTLIAFLLVAFAHGQTRNIALTFDDLPATHGGIAAAERITDQLLKTLSAFQVPAIGFVNESKVHIDGEENSRLVDCLNQWLGHGHELGNHTYSHISIDNNDIEAYKADVIRGEKITKRLLAARGQALRYFRHTQLRTGPTEAYKAQLDAFLQARGYTVAPVTIDNNEYIFAFVYQKAQEQGDSERMATTGQAYITYMEQMVRYYEQLSRDFLGYEVRQILLLHANALNADYLDELLHMLQERGYAFTSLGHALRDEAYRLPEVQSRRGLSWLLRWMLAAGEEMPAEPEVSGEIMKLFRNYSNQ